MTKGRRCEAYNKLSLCCLFAKSVIVSLRFVPKLKTKRYPELRLRLARGAESPKHISTVRFFCENRICKFRKFAIFNIFTEKKSFFHEKFDVFI
jgi:hypothetical protein